MPTRRQSSCEGAVELGIVMHLGNGVHAPVLRGLREVAGDRVIHLGEDDEDAIGAPGARLGNLIGVEHEVLAQGGQRGRGARSGQIFGAPWNEGPSVSTERHAAPPAS